MKTRLLVLGVIVTIISMWDPPNLPQRKCCPAQDRHGQSTSPLDSSNTPLFSKDCRPQPYVTYQNVLTHCHEQSRVRAPNSPEFPLGVHHGRLGRQNRAKDGKYKCTPGQPSYIVPWNAPDARRQLRRVRMLVKTSTPVIDQQRPKKTSLSN